jgi:transposase
LEVSRVKVFRDVASAREQVFLLPPSVNEFVERESPVRVLVDVVDRLDVSLLEARHKGGGAPAYSPRMLFTALLYAYSEGIRSSRKIEQALKSDVRFMFIAGMSRPDYRTIARFRRANEAALCDLFTQVVHLCQECGLVLMEHTAVDGTKIRADVSARRTYGEDRLQKALDAAEERVKEALKEAEETDQGEDALYGDKGLDEIPEALKDATKRKELLDRAMEKLKETGHKAVCATDLESRVMKTNDGNRAAYNAQAVVDRERQVIVAADVTQDCTDNRQLPAMLESAASNTGAYSSEVTADCGYHGVNTLAYIEKQGVNAFVPVHGKKAAKRDGCAYNEADDTWQKDDTGEVLTFRGLVEKKGKTYRVYRGKRKDGEPFSELYVREDGQRQRRMQAKLASEEGKAVYRHRQQVVEPVFGRLKTRFGLRRFNLRGLAGARIEFLLACMAHNFEKIRLHADPRALAMAV